MTARTRRRRFTFSTQTLLLQMGVLLLVVASTAVLYTWLTYQRLTGEVESRALAVAQTVAADTNLRAVVDGMSAAPTLPPNAVLRTGPVQAIAESIRTRTHALFVVVTDDDGIRLSHPTPELLGQRVSTNPSQALSGREVVEEQTGTLGPSARAKVPIWDQAHHSVVGEVSVGFSNQSIQDSAAAAITPVLLMVGIALLLGALASTFLMRRLRHLTLGLEPEEIVTLVQDQEVVLYGVAEGVIGVAADGRVTVCNAKARRLLNLGDIIGRQFRSLSIPAPIIELLDSASDQTSPHPSSGPSSTVQVVVGPSVLLVSVRKVLRGNTDLGWVLTVLDRTQVEELSRQLDAVGALSSALRIQRHEFANRLHTVSGLLNIGEVDEASLYLRQTLETGPLKYPVEHADRLQDSYLQAFVGAKGFQASERGVLLRIGSGTLIRGRVLDPQDITTVLGNLIDNAIDAAVHGAAGSRWIELELLSEEDTLHLVVADSGDGVVGDLDLPFVEGQSTRAGRAEDSAHGQGLGLPLSRRIARNRGGDVWLAEPGVPGGPGAVFCARLPGVLEAPAEERPAGRMESGMKDEDGRSQGARRR